MKRTLFLLVFVLFSIFGISKPIDSLIVAYGGGITGQITEYKIIQKRIYKSNYRLVKTGQSQTAIVSSKHLKKIYKSATVLVDKKNGFEKPGNIYKSVTIYSKGKKVVYNWGEVSFEPPQEVKDFYDQFLNMVKELKFQ